MLGFIVIPLLAAFGFLDGLASGAFDYLNRALLPSAPTTNPLSPPYTPPFTGGQCYTSYNVDYSVPSNAGGFIISGATTTVPGRIIGSYKDGAVYGLEVQTSPTASVARIPFGAAAAATGVQINSLSRVDGSPDSCGDLPNPDSGEPVAGSGLAESGQPPDLEEDAEPVYEGSPIAAVPSFAAILAAAIAAAKAAGTALEAIVEIAKAIEAIGDLLNRLKDFLDGEEKPKNRSVFKYDFGSIERDGFLRLYPFVNLAEFKAEMLDLQFLSIPTYYGKYFGEKSPNFYRFKELGYIAFVSPTFGVLSQVPLEFGRVSIPIPDDSIGFFFHLGLEGGIIANVSAFYSTPPVRS